MSLITFDPLPPFEARQGCMGHVMGYATFWEVVDSRGMTPWSLIDGRDPDTIIDEAYCKAAAERLNREAAK